MKSLRLAVIGGGVIGAKHAELISNYRGVDLVGISDIDQSVNSLADQYKVAFYNELEDLLLTQRPDGVIISVPNSQHQTVDRICARHKIHL